MTIRRPGDILLDRYLPDASVEDRERAREAFRAHAQLLIRIGERVLEEERSSSDGKPDQGDVPEEVPEVHKSC